MNSQNPNLNPNLKVGRAFDNAMSDTINSNTQLSHIQQPHQGPPGSTSLKLLRETMTNNKQIENEDQLEIQINSQPEIRVELVQSNNETQNKLNPNSKPNLKPKPTQVKIQAQTQVKAQPNPKPNPNPKPKPNPNPKPIQNKSKLLRQKPNPKPKPKPKPKPNPKPKPRYILKKPQNQLKSKSNMYDISKKAIIGSLLYILLSLPQVNDLLIKFLPEKNTINIYKNLMLKGILFSIIFVMISKRF